MIEVAVPCHITSHNDTKVMVANEGLNWDVADL